MKNKLLIFIILMMLMGMTASANSESVFYDFEDYKTAHASPDGWASANVWELEPGEVDEAHGTSLKVLYGGLPRYKFAEPVTDGKYLVSFEIYFEDFNQSYRLHATSPTSGRDSHSIIRFDGGEIQSADTGADSWGFDAMQEIKTHTWYQVDMLFDMDNKKLHYYIDGAELATKSIAFDDMSLITFRTESGSKGSTLYMDNASFKPLSAGGFDSEFKSGVAPVGKEFVTLNFKDAIDKNSLSGVEIYNMGNNPFSYTAEKVSADVVKTGVKTVALNLEEPLKRSSIYKIYAPGVKTIFGDTVTNDTVYFATGGVVGGRLAVDADFSTIETVGNFKPILPADGVEWIKGENGMIHPRTTDDSGDETVTVAEFVQNKGSKSAPDNFSSLRRNFNTAFNGRTEMEFKLKAKLGNQSFVIVNSQGEAKEIFKISNENVIAGDETVAIINPDIWYTFNVYVDKEDNSVKINIDDKEVKKLENVEISEISGVIFEQRNLQETYGTTITKEECAHMMIAYFKLYAEAECTSLILVNFEDSQGVIHYPEGDIPTDIVRMNMIFSKELNNNTVDGGISLLYDGEIVSEEYEYSNGVYSVKIPDYLNGMASYEIDIAETVKDIDNNSVVAQNGVITTDGGIFEGKIFKLEDLGDTYNLNAEVIHTDKSKNDFYISFAEYKGNLMIGYKAVRIVPSDDDRRIEFSENYMKNEDSDRVVAFLWDGLDSMNPIIRAQKISMSGE